MMASALDIQLDIAEIQRQLACILSHRPSPLGASAERRPVLGISGARDKYSLKIRTRRASRLQASPYTTKTPRPRIRTTPLIASAVRTSVRDHVFPRACLTPRAQPNRKTSRRRLHEASEEFTLSYDVSKVRGDVSTKLDDVANPALHDISMITSHSPLPEQVSTNESHLQRIQFDALDRPLHSTMNYPLHSTLAMTLNASNVSYGGEETAIRIDTTLRDDHPDEIEHDVDATCNCSEVTSTPDLEASLGPNPSMMNWLQLPDRRDWFTTPTKQTGMAYESMTSNHPKGCFDVIKSTIKKKKQKVGVYNKKDLSKKMKRFHRAVHSYQDNSVVLLAEL